MSSFRSLCNIYSAGTRARWCGGNVNIGHSLQMQLLKGIGTTGSVSLHRSMSSQSQYETLKVTCEDGLRVITFNRPEKKNAISEKMFEEVVDALKEAADDPGTLVTATTGAGNVYTAGNDKKNFLKMTPTAMANLLIRYMGAYVDFPKPLVAVINGHSVGAGTTLLPLYDAVFATESAIFFTPFSSLGIVAEGMSTYTFPKIMGPGKAAELLLFEKKVSAAEACKLGLVNQVFPDKSFQEQVWPQVQAMTKLPNLSLVYSKRLCRDAHREELHKINVAECSRVTERLMSVLCPDSKEYKKFAASLLPQFPVNAKV